jgi:hypothetical protein
MQALSASLKSAFLAFAAATSALPAQIADKFTAFLTGPETPDQSKLYRKLRAAGLNMQEAKHAFAIYTQLKRTSEEDFLRLLRPGKRVNSSEAVKPGKQQRRD